MSAASSGRGLRGRALWLRWSWRDLRARWLQVLAIALVIALGIGSYVGLTSVTRWRRISTDDAYRQLQMYDLRAELAKGSLVDAGELRRIAGSIDEADKITAMEERLVSDVQVDASIDGQTILVPGLLYGLDLSDGGPHVNALYTATGRSLDDGDEGTANVVLERNFAAHYKLPPSGDLEVSGGHALHYVGQVLTPEYFLVTTEQGSLLAEANFAAVFASLDTVQNLTGNTGRVSDLVLTLAPGTNIDAVRRSLGAAFEAAGVAVTINSREEDPVYRLNDRDIKSDQQVFEILAVLVFAGALGAAFNLSSRIVDAQRREIGIAMALGLPAWRIAIRPMLVGAQVALLGVVLGLGAGFVLGRALISMAGDLQPLPAWRMPLQLDLFALAAGIGLVLPLLATAWPVWRALRVPPIETIRPAYRLVRGGLTPLARWLRLPGDTVQQMPVRNLIRSPRRALLTGLGIAAALAALVSFVGVIDSFFATTSRGEAERIGQSPGRVQVSLSDFYPEDGSVVQTIESQGVLKAAEPGLLLSVRLTAGDRNVDAELELLSFDSAIWRPSLIDGVYDRDRPGIYISELAAKDLHVHVGSVLSVIHPKRQPSGEMTFARTQLPVLGIHPHPFRFAAFMDVNQAVVFGLEGLANRMEAAPVAGASPDDVKSALFDLPGVASMQSVGDLNQSVRDLLNRLVVVLRVVEVAMLLIALLIAFNSVSINMDERAREHATMFAFGLPVTRVLRLAVVESLLLGILATILGLAGGWFLLRLIVTTRIADTLPDVYVKPALSDTTLIITAFVGIVCVSLAPLLTWRRLSRMDVPGALKVVE